MVVQIINNTSRSGVNMNKFKMAESYYYNSNLILMYYIVCVKGIKTYWAIKAELINGTEIEMARFDSKKEAEQKLTELISEENEYE